MKDWNLIDSDLRSNNSDGVLSISYKDCPEQQIVLDYIGYEYFDLNVKIDSVTTQPNNIGDCRYVVSGQIHYGLSGSNLQYLGLGESSIWMAGPESNQAVDITRDSRNVGLREAFRREYREDLVTPTLRVSTTNANFRKVLNTCKSGTFCVLKRDNRVGIYNSDKSTPTVTPVQGAEWQGLISVASVDYSIMYYALYRRKQNLLGIMNILSTMGDYDITEYGIIDGRLYLVIGSQGFSARLLFTDSSAVDTGVEIPDVKTKRTNNSASRRSAPQSEVAMPAVAEVTIDFTEEESTRLNLWMAAHSQWVTSRNQQPSTSRQVWFSHYSMMLIQSGGTPDELDFQIMSKV